MKQGTALTKAIVILFSAAILLYIGGAAWHRISSPFTFVTVSSHTVDDSAEAVGLLVREETVLTGGSGVADILPGEGEKVGAGQLLAVFYQDAATLEGKRDVRTLELELEQLEYSLVQDTGGQERVRLDEEIIDTIVTLRGAVSAGSYANLNDYALSLKSLIFRREHTHDAAGEGIQAMIAETSRELTALRQSMARNTTVVSAPFSGVFSGQIDGREALLTPAALEDLSVSSFQALRAQPPGPKEGVGKLITSSRWYLALLLPEEAAARLTENEQVSVIFSRVFSDAISMRVESVSQSQGGQAAVVLSSTRSLSKTTLLREQTVDIVYQRYTGIRVPKRALRLDIKTETDPETGEVVREHPVPGVYTVTGAAAEFKPVTITYEGEDFYLLSPNPSSEQDKRILRAGDEVILSSEELYDGKVVR
ncbi:MAG: hypothetical protein GX585_05315 [Clostridiales bacterium]|nr:hypothetical protein [Clostridiales bacterium]